MAQVKRNTYKNTMRVMQDYGERIEDNILDLIAQPVTRRNGKSYNHQASRQLENSIEYDVIDVKGIIQLRLHYIDYGPTIRNQKTGAQEGNILRGRRPNSKPPPVDAIMRWMDQKKLQINVGNGETATSRRGPKLAALKKQTAFKIAKRIGKVGQSPFNFLQPYVTEVTSDQYMKDLSAALIRDGYTSLSKPIAAFNRNQ